MIRDKTNTNNPGCQGADKAVIRQRVLARRAAMTPDERRRASKAATAHLLGLSAYGRAKRVALFLSFGDEIDTWPLLEATWRAGKVALAPRVDRRSRRLRWGEVASKDDLEPGGYQGIMEPVRTLPDDGVRPDLVVVPGVAFDEAGYRIGYGAGYYDRCLAEWPTVPRIGFAFEGQRIHRVPRESHDVPVHGLVTEAGVICFSSTHP